MAVEEVVAKVVEGHEVLAAMDVAVGVAVDLAAQVLRDAEVELTGRSESDEWKSEERPLVAWSHPPLLSPPPPTAAAAAAESLPRCSGAPPQSVGAVLGASLPRWGTAGEATGCANGGEGAVAGEGVVTGESDAAGECTCGNDGASLDRTGGCSLKALRKSSTTTSSVLV
jgi:hypothetical protein